MQYNYSNIALFYKKSYAVGTHTNTQTHTHYCIETPGTVLTIDQAAEAYFQSGRMLTCHNGIK